MAGARIVAYTYGDLDWQGDNTDAATTTSILLVGESGGTFTARTSSILPFYAPEEATDQIRELQTALNASAPDGVYTLTYDSTTQRVTIATTNAVDFTVYPMSASVAWTGLVQADTMLTSLVGAVAPGAVVELYGVTINAIADAPRVQMGDYRMGRSVATAWGNHATHTATLYIRSRDVAIFQTGYVLSGRVRLYQDTTNAVPYSATNPGGYVDGYVVGVTNLTEDGDLGEIWTCEMLMAVNRG